MQSRLEADVSDSDVIKFSHPALERADVQLLLGSPVLVHEKGWEKTDRPGAKIEFFCPCKLGARTNKPVKQFHPCRTSKRVPRVQDAIDAGVQKFLNNHAKCSGIDLDAALTDCEPAKVAVSRGRDWLQDHKEKETLATVVTERAELQKTVCAQATELSALQASIAAPL